MALNRLINVFLCAFKLSNYLSAIQFFQTMSLLEDLNEKEKELSYYIYDI